MNNKYENNLINKTTARQASHTEGTGGALRASRDENTIIHNFNDENTGGQQSCNRTLVVVPSFCGKTHLLLNKFQLFRLSEFENK